MGIDHELWEYYKITKPPSKSLGAWEFCNMYYLCINGYRP